MNLRLTLLFALLSAACVFGKPPPPNPPAIATRGLRSAKRTSEWGCEDVSSDCPSYKASGYCDSSSVYYTYMVEECIKTCDFCDDFCDDLSDSCASYKDQGHCSSTSSLYEKMEDNCRETCGMCGSCEDFVKYCVSWERYGYCTGQYEAYMQENCKMSCGVCTAATTSPPTEEPTTTQAPTTTPAGETTTEGTSGDTTTEAATTQTPTTTSGGETTTGGTGGETTTEPGTTTSSSLPADAQECLDAHNSKRALHNAPAMVWDQTLVADAQDWADHLLAQGSLVHDSNRGSTGENLFGGTGTYTYTFAVDRWYDEINDYDFDNPGFSGSTGHFTQVVWKASTKLACAKAADGQRTYIVSRYSPQGNFIGQFAENVEKNT